MNYTKEVLNCKKNQFGGKFKFGLSAPSYIDASKNFSASFDGRKIGEPFGVHISCDASNTYTDLINFSSKIDYSQNAFNGNVVDFFVTPDFISDNFEKFVDFIMLSIKVGFFEMQMNVVSSATLIEARKNPEKIDFNIQEYIENDEKKEFGYEISLEELEKEILEDKEYYLTGGGVTFSGGECLLQFKTIEPLLKKLKDDKINICDETSLNVPSELVDIAIKYVDEFYIDFKILDNNKEQIIGANSKLFYKNVDEVLNHNSNVTFRMPLVYDYTYTKENINQVIEFVKKNNVKKIELFQLHNLGEYKYKLLNKEIKNFEKVNDKDVNEFKKKLESFDVDVKIIKI